MSARPLAIAASGMVSSVGLSSPAACAAIRAGLTNPVLTEFVASNGDPIVGHAVPLQEPWRGRARLARMAAAAIEEALSEAAVTDIGRIPLLLCVAETPRPGRLDGLDDELFQEIQGIVGAKFAPGSLIIAKGRVAAAAALHHAQQLIYSGGMRDVLIAATDSLLSWPTLRVLDQRRRILTGDNSNGFMPGEGAAAVLVRSPTHASQSTCIGLGFGTEVAHIDSEEPLRADGLTHAVKTCLADAECVLHQLDLRIADVSGEQYYFKEAALALGRILRERKEHFDLWHPAECMGETGATAGVACLVVSMMALRKQYAPGRGILIHLSADSGERAAIIARAH